MASTTSTPLSLSSSSALINAKAPARPESTAATLPALPPVSGSVHSHTHHAKTSAFYTKIARNVVAKATGEAPAEVVIAETPEVVKKIQEAWNKLEDKYAVTSLAVAGGVALWASAGMISAIEKLPLIPGVLELVGIGYSGWFAYQNLIFKPDREALFRKIKDTYNEIIGAN